MALPTLLLNRTSSQTITTATSTAISWESATTNSGPESWWDVGTPTQVVMPWPGPYIVTVMACWDEVDLTDRFAWLHSGTSITTDADRVAVSGHISTDASEACIYSRFSQIVNVANAGDIYMVGVRHTRGSNLILEVQFGHPPATASFTYIGGGSNSQLIIDQAINRASLW